MSTAGRPVKIPGYQAALRMVASHAPSNLTASTTDEILGYPGAEDQLTKAETERLNRAVDQVVARLRAMGSRS